MAGLPGEVVELTFRADLLGGCELGGEESKEEKWKQSKIFHSEIKIYFTAKKNFWALLKNRGVILNKISISPQENVPKSTIGQLEN